MICRSISMFYCNKLLDIEMTISENEYSGSFGHYFQHYLPDNRFGDIENILEKKGIFWKNNKLLRYLFIIPDQCRPM